MSYPYVVDCRQTNIYLLSDVWLSYTFKNDARVAKKCTDVHGDLVDHIKAHHIPSGDFVAYSILQPFPRSFARHSKARGGNMLGVDRIQDNALLLITAIQVERHGSWPRLSYQSSKRAWLRLSLTHNRSGHISSFGTVIIVMAHRDPSLHMARRT